MNKKLLYTIIAVVVVAIAYFAWWQYFYKPQPLVSPNIGAENQSTSLGGQISRGAENPADKIPDANPFGAQVNPFGGTKANPYSDIKTNPFQ